MLGLCQPAKLPGSLEGWRSHRPIELVLLSIWGWQDDDAWDLESNDGLPVEPAGDLLNWLSPLLFLLESVFEVVVSVDLGASSGNSGTSIC